MANRSLINWDPFRAIRRWDPWSELREMQYEMDKLFDRFGVGKETGGEPGLFTWIPPVESYAKGNDLIFKCELPGVDPKDVDITLDESTRQLVIKGERKSEKEAKEKEYIHREMTYGSFERRFTLPEGVKSDQVKAKFQNGILEVSLPVPEVTKAKKIEIETPKMIEGEATDVKKKAA